VNLKELFARDPWRWSTFQGSRDQVLLMGLETTFREKLEWLEEAETLSLRLRAARERRRGESGSSPEPRDPLE